MTDINSISLARYLAGECGPGEREQIASWIEADPARQEMMVELTNIWRQGPARRATLDIDAFWNGIAARMERCAPRSPARLVTETARPPADALPAVRKWRRSTRAAAVAAVIALLAAIPLARTVIGLSGRQGYASVIREVATRRGERARVTLADGIVVILGPDSKLRFPASFGAGLRELDLQGQAHFTVMHDERRPVRIRTARAVTEDLGTEFVVREYQTDSSAWVAVASGRVAVAATGDTLSTGAPVHPLLLGAGAVGRIDAAGRVTSERGASVGAYLAWTSGELRFQRASLAAVALELGRWYDLEVRLDSSLVGRTVTARFRDQSADAVLQSLATVLDLRVSRDGKSVTLLPSTRGRNR